MPDTNPKTYEAIPSRKVAFLGLGVMGYPMAGHLARAGHQVTVYNRTALKSEAWCKDFIGVSGLKHALTPRLAAQGADIVFCCVGNDDDLRSVTLGADGAFAGMNHGAIFVDHTTASAEVARELFAAAKNLGLQFIDAPVSGGQAGAENGQLAIMVGGEEAPVARATPVIQAYAKAIKRIGGP
ncbi:MAG: NAD(P)-dependent oxidoreductase, partial [Rhodoferax sp.]